MNERRNYHYTFMIDGIMFERDMTIEDLLIYAEATLPAVNSSSAVEDFKKIERKAEILDGLVDLFMKSIEQGSPPSISMKPDPNEAIALQRKLVWIIKVFRLTGISYAMDGSLHPDQPDRRTWPERIVDALEELVKAGQIAEETGRAKE